MLVWPLISAATPRELLLILALRPFIGDFAYYKCSLLSVAAFQWHMLNMVRVSETVQNFRQYNRHPKINLGLFLICGAKTSIYNLTVDLQMKYIHTILGTENII